MDKQTQAWLDGFMAELIRKKTGEVPPKRQCAGCG